MVRITHKLTVLGAVSLLVASGLTGTVLARNGADDTTPEVSSSPRPSTSVMPTRSPSTDTGRRNGETEAERTSRTETEHPSVSPRAEESHRLAKDKLDVCAKKTKHVNQVMIRINERATSQLAVFTKISDRTQAFYTAKGKTVAGYSALVAAASAAKQKAVTDIAALKSGGAFSCDSANPKGSVEAFKAKTKLVVADLKAYKTAVKNLIVAVKSVQPAEGVN